MRHDPAVAVDHEGLGKARHAVAHPDLPVGIEQDGKRELAVPHERTVRCTEPAACGLADGMRTDDAVGLETRPLLEGHRRLVGRLSEHTVGADGYALPSQEELPFVDCRIADPVA